MALSQTREVIEDRKGFGGLLEIDARTCVVGERVEDQEAGMGSLERIFEDGGVAEVEGGGGCGDGSAQNDETRRIAMKAGEARVNDF